MLVIKVTGVPRGIFFKAGVGFRTAFLQLCGDSWGWSFAKLFRAQKTSFSLSSTSKCIRNFETPPVSTFPLNNIHIVKKGNSREASRASNIIDYLFYSPFLDRRESNSIYPGKSFFSLLAIDVCQKTRSRTISKMCLLCTGSSRVSDLIRSAVPRTHNENISSISSSVQWKEYLQICLLIGEIFRCRCISRDFLRW